MGWGAADLAASEPPPTPPRPENEQPQVVAPQGASETLNDTAAAAELPLSGGSGSRSANASRDKAWPRKFSEVLAAGVPSVAMEEDGQLEVAPAVGEAQGAPPPEQ